MDSFDSYDSHDEDQGHGDDSYYGDGEDVIGLSKNLYIYILFYTVYI